MPTRRSRTWGTLSSVQEERARLAKASTYLTLAEGLLGGSVSTFMVQAGSELHKLRDEVDRELEVLWGLRQEFGKEEAGG